MFVAITGALWGFCGRLIMVSGPRGPGWGRSGYIKLRPRSNIMTKEAKCGQRQFFHASASEKAELRGQVMWVLLILGFREQEALNYSLGFPSPSPPNLDSVSHGLCQYLEHSSGSVFEFGPSHFPIC